MAKTYKIQLGGQTVESETPGQYAGHRKGKIFGTLDCESGKRLMAKENRVFFLTLEDAITEGYRPCRKCRPMYESDFRRLSYLIKEDTLNDFYNRDDR